MPADKSKMLFRLDYVAVRYSTLFVYADSAKEAERLAFDDCRTPGPWTKAEYHYSDRIAANISVLSAPPGSSEEKRIRGLVIKMPEAFGTLEPPSPD